MVEHTSEATAYMLNPDVYGTVTYGKGAQELPQSKGQPDVVDYIKALDLTTTKGYYIEAYYYVEVGTVQFIYTGEVIPYGGMWMSDDDADEALNDAYGVSVMDITHQQKIDALGEPSMTAEEVIAALGY
jgi:hypothetical protein